MTKLIHWKITVLLACILAMTTAPLMAEVVVIVNEKNPNISISKTDLNRLFLGKVKTFSDGSRATILYQSVSNPSRSAFDLKFLGKNVGQMNSYWSRQMFSGNGVPPQELVSDLSVLEMVSKDKSLIGYIDDSALNESVAKVTITK